VDANDVDAENLAGLLVEENLGDTSALELSKGLSAKKKKVDAPLFHSRQDKQTRAGFL
jgi:hypothetical protein